jgi:hypothetical protein
MEIDITPEQAIDSLKQLINLDGGNKNIFSAQDSMTTLNLDDSILGLNVKLLDGVPSLLYTEEIYNDEKEIGIDMPIDRLVKIDSKTIVLIGVSGCGKTRTCYDFCRKYWALYFDCTADEDFKSMIRKLKVSETKAEETQIRFERLSEKLIECLIVTRLLVLQTLYQRNPNLECFEWLCIQRSRRSRLLFSNIFERLSELPWSVTSNIYTQLKRKFQEGGGRIIFDESK